MNTVWVLKCAKKSPWDQGEVRRLARTVLGFGGARGTLMNGGWDVLPPAVEEWAVDYLTLVTTLENLHPHLAPQLTPLGQYLEHFLDRYVQGHRQDAVRQKVSDGVRHVQDQLGAGPRHFSMR